MANEIIFIITILWVYSFVLLCFFGGRRWLHAAIAINLLLISIFGAKLISLFGHVSNTGNIFYAAVFFSGQLLVEHFGKEEGKKSIWLGFAAVVFFVMVGQLTTRYAVVPEATGAATALDTLFSFTPRIALASLTAYLVSQSINIHLYSYLKNKWQKQIWQRSITANIVGQLFDSVIFFSIAFSGTIPSNVFVSTLLTGFVVKVICGSLTIPFIYLSYKLKTTREVLEEESEAILSGIGEGIIVTDLRGKILLVNKAFQAMLGWDPHEVLGKALTDIVKRQDESGNPVPFEERAITRVLLKNQVTPEIVGHSYFVRKNKTRFPVRITVNPVVIDRKIMGAVELFSDVTEEQRLEKLRTDFLSLASHQLRTPLSGTRWIIETLRSDIFGDMNKKQKEYVEMLSNINSQMIKLATDTLNILRLESGQIVIKKEPVLLKKLYQEVITGLEASAKRKDVALVISQHIDASMAINTDCQMVRSIMGSLVENAISYSRTGQKVVLDYADSKQEVILSVKDEGIGIPQGEQQRIFDRFYRASNAKLVKTDGTGLGLSTSAMLAQKIGATLTFTSQEDHGSTFSLHIPKKTS